MTSKAANRRRRRNRNRIITMAGGETAKMRDRAGQGRSRDAEDARSATETAAKARLRVHGYLGGQNDERALLDPLMGCAVGRALIKNQRRDLWSAVQHMRRVWAAYDAAIGAPSRHAQCLRILAATGALTSDRARVDDRTADERDTAAVTSWMRLQGWLDHVSRHDRSVTIAAVVDDHPVTSWPGLARALECVADGIAGNRITPRMVSNNS